MNKPTRPASRTAQRPARFCHGFSLIEVTIALGVVSFALVALFGLLPTGLSTFRRSIDRSVASQVAQGIINKARQTDFASLSTLVTASGSPKRYTEEGEETTDSAKTIYVAKVDVEFQVAVPAATTFQNASMAKIRVRVANSPNGNETAVTSDSASVQDFTAIIPKM